jgi:putative transposase
VDDQKNIFGGSTVLTNEEMLKHLSSLNLTSAGIDYVMRVRASPPARRPEANYFLNSPMVLQSRRMGHSIRQESSTVAHAVGLELEYDTEGVLEYWEEIPAVIIEGKRKDGNRYRGTYVADYLVIRNDSVIVLAPKDERELKKLCRERPSDWKFKDGQYHNLPAERAFRLFGIQHIVIGSASINQVRAENLNTLIQVRKSHRTPRQKQLEVTALRLLEKSRALTLSNLSVRLGSHDVTPVLRLIAEGKIIFNIEKSRLSKPEGVWLALNRKDLDLVEDIDHRYPSTLSGGAGLNIDKVLTPRAAAGLAMRLAQLDGSIPAKKSARTLRRYRQRLRENSGDVRALMPRHGMVRRRKSLLSRGHERFIRRVIRSVFATAKKVSRHAAYLRYQNRFTRTKLPSKGESPATYLTFCKRIRWLNQSSIARGRGGRRAANAAMQPTDPSLRGLRASRSWQKVHLDHYLTDLFMVVVTKSDRKPYTSKAWITLMTDEYSGAVLAMTLSLRHPSRWACAAILRDCVRRHGRLPETVVVDQGVEFRSVFFETWLAKQEVNKQERPTSAPRFGGYLERVFGITKQELLGMLDGNTADGKGGRGVSGSHQPRRRARLSPLDAYRALDEYFFKYFNCHPRGEAIESPNIRLKEGLRRFGFSGIVKKYDLTFLVSTAMPAPRAKYTVDPFRGIRVYNHLYWTNALATSRADNVRDVRIDISDDNIIYFPLRRKWQVALRRGSAESAADGHVARLCASIVHYEGRAQLAAAKHDRQMDLVRLTDRHEKSQRSRRRPGRRSWPDAAQSKARVRHVTHREITKPLTLKFGRKS